MFCAFGRGHQIQLLTGLFLWLQICRREAAFLF